MSLAAASGSGLPLGPSGFTLAEFDAKPGTSVGPPGVGGAGGDAEDFGALVEGQTAETP